MDFSQFLEKRRSINRFQKRRVEPEIIAALVEVTLRAPSEWGFNPWEFIVVDEPNLIIQLSEVEQDSPSFLAGAPMVVVICADPKKSDFWVEEASIASIVVTLAAQTLGLGNCWIQVRQKMHSNVKTSEKYVREVLNIPQHLKVESIIAIGYPDEQKEGYPSDKMYYKKILVNTFEVRHEF